jgi:hypothetical protein
MWQALAGALPMFSHEPFLQPCMIGSCMPVF